MVYNRALHPELFDLQCRRTDRHGDYEVELWITPGGHTVRFNFASQTVTETVIERGDHLPETGLIYALPCLGEKDYEMEPHGRTGFVTTIQTETLSDNLYQATLREMQNFARETGSMSYQWADEAQVPCLSVLDAQKFRREFHIQSYHLYGGSGVVLRTQSIFECRYER
ncbi:MAG: DUF2617 family protein [Phycisphaeraceae bacterium]|nr:DUF2617 family protein [Phycisphaeraceae bacterium]